MKREYKKKSLLLHCLVVNVSLFLTCLNLKTLSAQFNFYTSCLHANLKLSEYFFLFFINIHNKQLKIRKSNKNIKINSHLNS